MVVVRLVLGCVLIWMWGLCSVPAGAQSLVLTGGQVFDGEAFVQQDLYIVDGQFVASPPEAADRTIDVTGHYLVPPYGDAHTHNLDRLWQLGFMPDQYVQEGVFYVQNLTSKVARLDSIRSFFATPETPDVLYSHQGITSTLGHPFTAYEPYAMGLNDPSVWSDSLDAIRSSRLDEGNSYLFMDTVEEARQKLPAYFAAGPDVVKLYLVDHERYEENSTNDALGDAGLSEEVFRFVAREAQARGLPVVAHINTAADFALAVDVGIDGFAHMPSWDGDPADRDRYQVADTVLDKAVAQDMYVTPTVAIYMLNIDEESEAYDRAGAFRASFIASYLERGGRVLVGSDLFGQTLRPEVEAIVEVDAMTPAQLLTSMSVQTPQALFPSRPVGRLAAGYEGSLLVLDSNPLDDASHLFDIEMRIKQGVVLSEDDG